MARNGSGTYNLPSNSWNPAINGATAVASDWQALINDVASALTQSVSRDGQSPLTGNLSAGGNRITDLAAGVTAGNSLRFEQLFSQGLQMDIASAATCDIGALDSVLVNITGTTTITSFGTNYNGPRFLRFAGALQLTNSATLVLPGGGNIVTAAGDGAIAVPLGNPGTGWRVIAFCPAAGNVSKAGDTMTGQLNGTVITTTGNIGAGTASPSFRMDVSQANPTNGIISRVSNSQNDSSRNGAQMSFTQIGLADWVIGQPANVNGFSFWQGRNTGSAGTQVFEMNSNGYINVAGSVDIGGIVDINNAANANKLCIKGHGTGQGTGIIMQNGVDSGAAMSFNNIAGSQIGSITVSSSNVAFNTSSDYRLKENVAPLVGSIERVKAIKPCAFNFKNDPANRVEGFIAHELQAVVPGAVVGEKDAVDQDGNMIAQGVDSSKIIPLLTSALQDAISRIDALEKAIAHLEERR